MEKYNIVEVGILDFDIFEHRIETYLHCLRRYQFAANFLNKSDVALDICCGSGYGTNILRQNCIEAIGIDRNEDVLAYAQKKYKDCLFWQRDITTFDNRGFFANIITMFECLDHLTKEDGLILLSRLAKACDRMLFVSLPCDHKRENNHWHLSEWTDKELKTELNKYFPVVAMFGQSWTSGVISFPYDDRRAFTIAVGIKGV